MVIVDLLDMPGPGIEDIDTFYKATVRSTAWGHMGRLNELLPLNMDLLEHRVNKFFVAKYTQTYSKPFVKVFNPETPGGWYSSITTALSDSEHKLLQTKDSVRLYNGYLGVLSD
jgi:hypothetical protein